MSEAYTDELTEEERRVLDSETTGLPAGEPPADPPAGDAAPADHAPAADPAPADANAGDGDDPEWAKFQQLHAGKSPEELARIAYQQSKRANAEGFERRRTQEQMDALKTRAQEIRDQRIAAAQEKRALVEKQLADDPDAAVRLLADRDLERETAEADREALAIEDDIALETTVTEAAKYIPNFAERAPKMFQLGRELGYRDEELHGIRDPRQLIVLSLAQMAGDLLRAGVIDRSGSLVAPQPTTAAPNDPRLKAPPALSTARAGGAAPPAASPNDRLKSLAGLSDAEFAKELTAEEFDKLFG